MKKREPLHLRGSMAALVTPFRGGRVDRKGLKRLVDFLLSHGTDALIPCGTTGESATLSYAEHEAVVELTIDYAAGRAPVIAGTGSNSTEEAIQLTRHAARAGADAVLLITPYYNKPSQEGLVRHFTRVAGAVDIPMVLYNVPGRTSVNLLPETMARLSGCRNIVGIKEATGDLKQVADLLARCGERFTVLSGDDFTTLPILSVGGKGVISVTANVAPADVSRMVHAYLGGDPRTALDLHARLWPLHRAMFLETNPVPVKTALAMMGLIGPDLRLPLAPLSAGNRDALRRALRDYGLLRA